VRSTRRGATGSLQYGQTRSLVVMNARQCGHMRRVSMKDHANSVRGVLCYNRGFPMVKTEREYRDDICQIGRLVFQKGWVAANDGNISIRLDAERVLATPTGVCKGMMQPDDLIIVDRKGNKIQGRAERTSEFAMHATIYDMRPDIKAVVHAHPPVATGFATAGKSLNLALLPEVVIGLGCVPLADYGLPGTPALTEPMLPLIPKYDALMMANHGAVCYGEDVFKAYFKMETMEHFARIQLVAELLGGPKVLPRTEVDKLLDSRTRYGVKAKSSGEPGCPVALEDRGGPDSNEERFYVTRSELIRLVDEAMKARNS
jgi:L-fuculose-phosphate aldolase